MKKEIKIILIIICILIFMFYIISLFTTKETRKEGNKNIECYGKILKICTTDHDTYKNLEGV